MHILIEFIKVILKDMLNLKDKYQKLIDSKIKYKYNVDLLTYMLSPMYQLEMLSTVQIHKLFHKWKKEVNS